MSERSDAFRTFRFGVERGKVEIGGFSQVGGLSRETTFEEFREGGVNGFLHKLATGTKFPNLTLKRGLTRTADLWEWNQKVIDGFIDREDISISLRDEAGEERWRWTVTGAYPVVWTGSELNASQAEVFVESIEFAHQGVRGHAV